MKTLILQGLLQKLTVDICDAEELAENHKYFLNMAKYKYDSYKQFSPGMRFIERFALWLSQFKDSDDKKIAHDFIKNQLIYLVLFNSLVIHVYFYCFPYVLKTKIIASGCE